MAFWGEYVPVAQRRARARKKMDKLRKEGKNIQPVAIEGRTIARSFWGKGWCKHLESFSDFSNRLPRGRTYVRNGSVCHLEVQAGTIEAYVSGSSLYTVSVKIEKLKPAVWKRILEKCSGQIGSMLELLQGKLSDQVMKIVTNREEGLFPKPKEIRLSCSCPDGAYMCKHVAAVLYGVGSRLDEDPALLFELRDADASELIASEVALPGSDTAEGDMLESDQLADIFGIDIEAETAGLEQEASPAPPDSKKPAKSKGRKAKRRKRPSRPQAGRPNAPVKQTKQDKPTDLPRIRPTGKSIKRLRTKLGLTVSGFARALGVADATVRRWEETTGRLKLHDRCHRSLAELHEKAKRP